MMNQLTPQMLQMLISMGGSGQGGGQQNNAPQIPIAQQRTQSNMAPIQQPQQQMNGQPSGGALGGITQAATNGQKLYNMATGPSPQAGVASPQAGTSGLSPNYPVAPGQYSTQQALEAHTGPMYASPYQAQQAQPWYNNLFGGSGASGAQAGASQATPFMQPGSGGIASQASSGAANGGFTPGGMSMAGSGSMSSPGMFGAQGANGGGGGSMLFGGSSPTMAAGSGAAGGPGAASAGTDSTGMFGSVGAGGAGTAAGESSPSWLSQLWDLL